MALLDDLSAPPPAPLEVASKESYMHSGTTMSSLLPFQYLYLEDHTQGPADSHFPCCVLLAHLPGQTEGVSRPLPA